MLPDGQVLLIPFVRLLEGCEGSALPHQPDCAAGRGIQIGIQ